MTGDFTGDGVVDFSDFFIFGDHFGGTDPRFDLDGNGSVDFGDFFIFADHFGQKTESPCSSSRTASVLDHPLGTLDFYGEPRLKRRDSQQNPYSRGCDISHPVSFSSADPLGRGLPWTDPSGKDDCWRNKDKGDQEHISI